MNHLSALLILGTILVNCSSSCALNSIEQSEFVAIEKAAGHQKILRYAEEDYPAIESGLSNLPSGIKVFKNNNNPILHINGDEIETKNWQLQLVMQAFSNIPNYLTEVHLQNLSLNPFVSSYLSQLLMSNSKSIQAFTLIDCTFAKECKLDWGFSNFDSLIKFELSKIELALASVIYILYKLPKSLKSLDIS